MPESTPTLLALALQLVYVAMVAVAPFFALAVVLLARSRSVPAALGSVVGAVAAVTTLVATAALALLSFRTGVAVFLSGLAGIAALCLAPLLLGRTIIRQTTGVDRESALRVAVTSWPLALAGSYVLFVSPSDFADYNITALSGMAAVLAWLAWATVVLLGPGVLGSIGVRLRRRLR